MSEALEPAAVIAAKADGVKDARACGSRTCDAVWAGLVVDNEGSTARDFLARERNFLSSLKACDRIASHGPDVQMHYAARSRGRARLAHSPAGRRA